MLGKRRFRTRLACKRTVAVHALSGKGTLAELAGKSLLRVRRQEPVLASLPVGGTGESEDDCDVLDGR